MQNSVILFNLPIDFKDKIAIRPPLALLYLGTVLKQNSIAVKIFDFQNIDISWNSVDQAISASNRCLVGFSCDSDNINRVINISNQLLRRYPNINVILGGPHVTHIYTPYLSKRRIVVRGEGEYAILLLAKYFLEDQGCLEDIPGIAYWRDNSVQVNSQQLGPYEDANQIPLPDYSLLPAKEKYSPAIITGRGCFYNCHFCSEGVQHKRWRPRSVENVVRELRLIKGIYKESYIYLCFADDTFTASPKRVNDICDAIDRIFPDKSKFQFFCEGRVNVLAKHPELIERLHKAGMLRLQIGIESSNQDILDLINKEIRPEEVEKVVATCAKIGVSSIPAMFICGLPGQTEGHIKKNLRFAKHLVDLAPGILEFRMVPLVLYPGTEFRNNSDKWGLSTDDPDFLSSRLHQNALANNSNLKAEQIDRICDQFNKQIHLYMLEQAGQLPTIVFKKMLIDAAELKIRTYVLKALLCYGHIEQLLSLRHRQDHRFMFEIPQQVLPYCLPQSIFDNYIFQQGNHYVINDGSPMCFRITHKQYYYYRYMCGKMTFEQIAEHVANEGQIDQKTALKECLDVYKLCEEHLAIICVTGPEASL